MLAISPVSVQGARAHTRAARLQYWLPNKPVRSCRPTVCLSMRPLEQAMAGDLLEVKTAHGHTELLEVIESWNSGTEGDSAVVQWKGQLLRLAAAAGEQTGNLQLTALGAFPAMDSLTVTSFPEMSKVLPSMHTHAGDIPSSITSAEVVESLDSLLQQVNTDASYWRDGNAPGDPIPTELQLSLFAAGELAALAAGQRGIVLVQLWNGWDALKGQPIYNPFTLAMLERVLAAPGIACCSSIAAGGVGLTGIVYADREPFASWAAHLASFGCQSNAVAGSAYYKLLIGTLLGYKPANVLAYVASSGEVVSPQLQQQVAQDIKRLSKVKPKLPWSMTDSNIRKSKVSPGSKVTAAAGKAGFGASSKKAGAARR